MALQAQVKTLEGLPEGVAELYTELPDNGGFLLDVEPVNGFALENVAGLKETLADRKSKAAERKTALAAFDGIDPAKARTALEKYAEIENWTPDQKAQEAIEANKAQLQDKFDKDLGELNAKYDNVNRQLHDALVVQGATAAIAEAGGNVKLLLPHVTKQMKLVDQDGKLVAKIVDDKGQPRVTMKSGSTDDMGLGELLETMKSSDDFGSAFAGSNAAGGGGGQNLRTPGGGSGKDVHLTFEQAQDFQTYNAAKAQAKKQGGEVVVADHQGWQPQQ